MEIPEYKRCARGPDKLSVRRLARKDMGFFDKDELVGFYSFDFPGKRYRDHFFPNDADTCKIHVQIRRDLFYLNLLREFYSTKDILLNI